MWDRRAAAAPLAPQLPTAAVAHFFPQVTTSKEQQARRHALLPSSSQARGALFLSHRLLHDPRSGPASSSLSLLRASTPRLATLWPKASAAFKATPRAVSFSAVGLLKGEAQDQAERSAGAGLSAKQSQVQGRRRRQPSRCRPQTTPPAMARDGRGSARKLAVCISTAISFKLPEEVLRARPVNSRVLGLETKSQSDW